jgi:hypothetical protein
MKKALTVLLILCIPMFMWSCSKDHEVTAADKNAKELLKFVRENKINKSDVYLTFVTSGEEVFRKVEGNCYFSIEAPFFITSDSGRHYNLERLIFFESRENNQGGVYYKELHIYFK